MEEKNSNDDISLKELFKKVKNTYSYLVSNWKVIIVAGIIGSIIGLTYSFSKKPTYTATLSFALESGGGGGIVGAASLASSFGFDLGGSGGGIFEGANLTELFKSRNMVEQTLLMPVNFEGKNISLAEMYIQNNDWRTSWNKKPNFKSISFVPKSDRKGFTRAQDSILGVIYGNLSKGSLSVGQRDKKIDIISIDVVSENELFAKYFAEALAKKVSDFYIDTKSKKARENMDILVKQMDSVRLQLNSAINGVAVATDNTFGLNPALNIRRAPSVRKQVDVQTNTGILTELIKQTELAKVTLRKETPLIQIIDSPILPLKKEKLGKLKAIIIGGFLAGSLVIFFLIIKKIISNLL
ncbi:lipopolysaccharide biosynthesis protein [Flavobacterium faecale]|uniref:Lipopolysaccharide biosynthesis protein n=1 Tax=Flavobacterium faecale TaxID=1355330 RepID=A0A2S1LCI0_9FLAO|nr:Wzz/FepE/Etk N-terminal domain-containing protein [Flavobacterium faecale]AWG21421.1 lipopolysaccharide biosynthesis protein [Flavobacterium faecale]